MPTRSQSHNENVRTAADPPFAEEDLPPLDLLDPLDRIHVLLGLGHGHPATSAALIMSGREPEVGRGKEIDPDL